MKDINKENSGWLLSTVWLQALEESARDFHGVKPRLFCYKAYEYATSNWIKALQDEYQIYPKKANTIKEALDNYIELGIAGGLFDNANQFTVTEIINNRVNIKVHKCPFLKVCKYLLKGGYTLRDITCARIGCFNAAIKILSGIDTYYEIVGVDIQEECEGNIERR